MLHVAGLLFHFMGKHAKAAAAFQQAQQSMPQLVDARINEAVQLSHLGKVCF
jgi:hypothetical protein